MQTSDDVTTTLCCKVPKEILDDFHTILKRKYGKWYGRTESEVAEALKLYIEKWKFSPPSR